MTGFITNAGARFDGVTNQAQLQVFGDAALARMLGLAALPVAPSAPDPDEARRRRAALPLDTVPPPRPLPGPLRVPVQYAGDFVGREAEFAMAALALHDGRGAVITGGPATGKSEFAAQLVYRYGQHFAGGVFWLSCEVPERIPDELAACAEPLGLAASDSAGRLDAVLGAFAAPLPRLVVFDNAEAVEAVQGWLPPAAGGCCILITSQIGFWPGELGVARIPLGPLPRAASVTMLRRLSGMQGAAASDLDAVAATLDDLPLALRMAGKQLEGGGAADLRAYRAEIEGRVGLGLERSFGAAWARLDEADATGADARHVLARAAWLRPGEWVPRRVLHAADPTEEEAALRRGLSRAVRAGLLRDAVDDGVLIHRQFARFVRLHAGPEAAADAAAALLIADRQAPLADPRALPHVLAAIAEAADRPAQAVELHLVAARLFLLQLDPLRSNQHVGAAQTVLEEATGLSEDEFTALELGTMAAVGQFALTVGQLPLAVDLLSTVGATLADDDFWDTRLALRVTAGLLDIALLDSDLADLAEHLAQMTLGRFQEAPPRVAQGPAAVIIGYARLAGQRGHFDEADALLDAALAQVEAAPAAAGVAPLTMLARADLRAAAGDSAGARAALEQAAAPMEAEPERFLILLVGLRLRQGRAAEALPLLEGAAERIAGSPVPLSLLRILSGIVAREAGKMDEAIRCFEAAGALEALPPGAAISERIARAAAALHLAALHADHGNLTAARAAFEAATALQPAAPSPAQLVQLVLATIGRRDFPMGSLLGWPDREATTARAARLLIALLGEDAEAMAALREEIGTMHRLAGRMGGPAALALTALAEELLALAPARVEGEDRHE